jgi:hypothetical protein
MKRVIEYELNGESVFIEVASDTPGFERTGRGPDGVIKAGERFNEVLRQVRPSVEAVLDTFRGLSAPDEIALEFGLKFGAKAGAIIASADSEATFKVAVKWANKKAV